VAALPRAPFTEAVKSAATRILHRSKAKAPPSQTEDGAPGKPLLEREGAVRGGVTSRTLYGSREEYGNNDPGSLKGRGPTLTNRGWGTRKSFAGSVKERWKAALPCAPFTKNVKT
jgi:hypothetical protein